MEKAILLQRIEASWASLDELTAELTQAQRTTAGPDGWSVKDHLAHLALWDDIRAGEVERISAGHDSAWRMTGALPADCGIGTPAASLRA